MISPNAVVQPGGCRQAANRVNRVNKVNALLYAGLGLVHSVHACPLYGVGFFFLLFVFFFGTVESVFQLFFRCLLLVCASGRLLRTPGQACIAIRVHTCLLYLCNLTPKAINLIPRFSGAEGGEKKKTMLIYGLRQRLGCRALLNDNSQPRSGLP